MLPTLPTVPALEGELLLCRDKVSGETMTAEGDAGEGSVAGNPGQLQIQSTLLLLQLFLDIFRPSTSVVSLHGSVRPTSAMPSTQSTLKSASGLFVTDSAARGRHFLSAFSIAIANNKRRTVEMALLKG